MDKDKFDEIVMSWAKGRDVQFRYDSNCEWEDVPHWNPIFEYRLKPIVYKRFLW